MNFTDALMSVATLTHTGDWGPGDGEWWWVLRPLLFLLWIVVIAFVIRFIVFRGFRGPWGGGGPRQGDERSGVERARDILAERYARGEIDGEEYRGRLEQLR